jgi:adenylate kinase
MRKVKIVEVVIFLGPPGSGKGTQARLLSRALKIPLMGMGDLLRNEINAQTARGQNIQKAVDSGEMPDWSLVCDIFEETLTAIHANRIIFDGIPRNSFQVTEVMNILQRRKAVVKRAVFLNVPEHILVQRIQQRFQCAQCGTSYSIKEGDCLVCTICQGVNFVRRNDDQQESMNNRFRVYQESIGALVSYYQDMGVLLELDGTKNIDIIHQKIMQFMDHCTPGKEESLLEHSGLV